jgi:hypothetical protein
VQRAHLLAILVLILVWVPVIGYGMWRSRIIPTNGVLAHVDLSLNVDSIDWGVCYEGETTNRSFTATNNGTVSHTLTIFTANWTVPEALFTFSVDVNNTVLAVDEFVTVTASLTPLLGAKEYATFAFDLVVWVED